MRIIFIKEYIDKESFDQWVTIEEGEVGILVDDVNSCIEMSEGFDQTIRLEGVPPGYYSKYRDDVD